MTTVFTSIWTFIKMNKWGFVLLFLTIIILFYNFGCESKVPSIMSTSTLSTDGNTMIKSMVTRAELSAELAYITAIAEKRFADLDHQDELKQMLANQAVVIASGGGLNPAGIISLLMGIFGVGAVIDNRKKANTMVAQANEIASLQKSIAING